MALKITVEATEQRVAVDGVLCRLYVGTTEGGVPVQAIIQSVRASEEDRAAFEAEIGEKVTLQPETVNVLLVDEAQGVPADGDDDDDYDDVTLPYAEAVAILESATIRMDPDRKGGSEILYNDKWLDLGCEDYLREVSSYFEANTADPEQERRVYIELLKNMEIGARVDDRP